MNRVSKIKSLFSLATQILAVVLVVVGPQKTWSDEEPSQRSSNPYAFERRYYAGRNLEGNQIFDGVYRLKEIPAKTDLILNHTLAIFLDFFQNSILEVKDILIENGIRVDSEKESEILALANNLGTNILRFSHHEVKQRKIARDHLTALNEINNNVIRPLAKAIGSFMKLYSFEIEDVYSTDHFFRDLDEESIGPAIRYLEEGRKVSKLLYQFAEEVSNYIGDVEAILGSAQYKSLSVSDLLRIVELGRQFTNSEPTIAVADQVEVFKNVTQQLKYRDADETFQKWGLDRENLSREKIIEVLLSFIERYGSLVVEQNKVVAELNPFLLTDNSANVTNLAMSSMAAYKNAFYSNWQSQKGKILKIFMELHEMALFTTDLYRLVKTDKSVANVLFPSGLSNDDEEALIRLWTEAQNKAAYWANVLRESSIEILLESFPGNVTGIQVYLPQFIERRQENDRVSMAKAKPLIDDVIRAMSGERIAPCENVLMFKR